MERGTWLTYINLAGNCDYIPDSEGALRAWHAHAREAEPTWWTSLLFTRRLWLTICKQNMAR